MPFFDQLKGQADKMQFEANKMMRVNSVQNEITGLKGQFQAKSGEVAAVVYELFKTQQLTDPKLVALCQAMQTIETAITAKEKEIENIKAEKAPGAAPAPAQPTRAQTGAVPVTGAVYGHICPKENIPLPENVMFCPNCGTKAIDVPAPAAPKPSVGTTPSVCPNCQAPLAPGAMFCPNCGTKVS